MADNIYQTNIKQYQLEIAIPGQFLIQGFGIGVDGIPEHNALVIRDSNLGPTFSIPGFGIEICLIPGLVLGTGTRVPE
jgi:hypothetical protein